MTLGVAEDAVRAPDLQIAEAKMAALRLAGFTAVRVTTNWEPGLVAPTADELRELRNVATAADLNGVEVYVSVYNPGQRTTPLDATAQSEFAQYAAAVARLVPSFDQIIVGNEPNLNRFWLPQFAPDGSNASAPAYLSLLAQTYDALKAVDPTITVWGGALRSTSPLQLASLQFTSDVKRPPSVVLGGWTPKTMRPVACNLCNTCRCAISHWSLVSPSARPLRWRELLSSRRRLAQGTCSFVSRPAT